MKIFIQKTIPSFLKLRNINKLKKSILIIDKKKNIKAYIFFFSKLSKKCGEKYFFLIRKNLFYSIFLFKKSFITKRKLSKKKHYAISLFPVLKEMCANFYFKKNRFFIFSFQLKKNIRTYNDYSKKIPIYKRRLPSNFKITNKINSLNNLLKEIKSIGEKINRKKPENEDLKNSFLFGKLNQIFQINFLKIFLNFIYEDLITSTILNNQNFVDFSNREKKKKKTCQSRFFSFLFQEFSIKPENKKLSHVFFNDFSKNCSYWNFFMKSSVEVFMRNFLFFVNFRKKIKNLKIMVFLKKKSIMMAHFLKLFFGVLFVTKRLFFQFFFNFFFFKA